MAFCLIKPLAEEFMKRLQSGEINPESLSAMSSKERNDYFSKFLGEQNAFEVNALFESKMLLKHKQAGMINWAQSVAGLKPEVRADIVAKINKLDRVLNPVEERAFLEDLAAKKLGTDVTMEEAKKIADLAKKAEEKRIARGSDMGNFDVRVEYGRAVMELREYVDSLNPGGYTVFNAVVEVANLPKSIMSSFDFSAPFRQGWGMMSRPEFWKAFPEMFKFAMDENAYKNMEADIITRPSYDKMKAAGLRITKLSDKLSEREEAFQSSLLDKVPGYRGSERAFTGFLNKIRADVFDSLLKNAEMAGEDTSKGSRVNRELANVVNDFTGSGNIGPGDKFRSVVPAANALFFSPRKISATVNMFNPQRYLDPRVSPTARKAALRNLVGSAGMTITLLGLAAAMGADVEKDPRSSDFGKIKIGNNRYDLTGGNGNYITLLARLITGKTKSTTSEAVSDLGEGYGASTRLSITGTYLRNKLAPLASLVADWASGWKDANGFPVSPKEEVIERVLPLIVSDTIQTVQDDPAAAFPNALLSMFGVGVQNFSPSTDWTQETGKELLQFKEKVGDGTFKKANDEYNDRVAEKIEQVKDSSDYEGLTDDEKQTVLKKLKADIKADIFKKYHFKYKQDKKEKPNPAVERLTK